MFELPGGIAAIKNVPEPLVKIFFHRGGQAVEGLGIDEVAARVFEEAAVEIELAQRPVLGIPRAALFEFAGERGRAADWPAQRGFLGEEEVLEEAVRDFFDVVD